MEFKRLLLFGWINTFLIPVCLVVGHFGTHQLSWKSDPLSFFAAGAPYGGFISLAMILSALSLVFLGILISRFRILGESLWADVSALLTGTAAGGLGLLAAVQDTASLSAKITVQQIQHSAAHNAGLMVFFNSALCFLVLSGITTFLSNSSGVRRQLGMCTLVCALFAQGAIGAPWGELLGLEEHAGGIAQRASFLLMWLGLVSLFRIASEYKVQERAKR